MAGRRTPGLVGAMSIWSTLKQALGLQAAPGVRAPEPVALSPQAVRRLQGLPLGRALQLDAVPGPRGYTLVAREVDADEDAGFHPDFSDLPVLCDDATHARLAGLTLDVDRERWLLRAEVTVRARETPNPDGRLYLTDHALAQGRVFFAASARQPPPLAADLLARDDVHSVMVRDHTLTVERAPGAPWPAVDRAVAQAVREQVLACRDPLRPADVHHDDGPLEAAIRRVVDERVRPALHADGGDLELLGVEDGIVRVHLVGACRSCPAAMLTLKGAVEKTLREAFPGEVDEVVAE